MKKLYSLAFLLMMLVGATLPASAYQLVFEWDEPGSVQIQTGSLSGPYAELAADQTSYTFETTSAFADVYIYATGDYFLTSLSLPDGTTKDAQVNYSGKRYAGGRWNSNQLKNFDGKPIHVNVAKINRSSEFTFDVVNGVDCFTAKFTASGYTLDLKKGNNTVMYDPAVDTNLQITYVTGTVAGNPDPALYSVTYDGTAVTKSKYYQQWDIPTVEPGKTVAVRVYEGDEPVVNECDLTLEIPADLEGCINTIRDWTLSKFIMNADGDYLTSGSFTVKEGTDLGINFNTEDFEITDLIYNGTSLKDKFQLEGARCRFTVTESGTLQIVGTRKAVETTTFTAYIMNPEGVNIENGLSTGEYLDLSNGEAVASDIKLYQATLIAADSKMYTFDIAGKNPLLFVSPKEGWYISTVQYKPATGSYEPQTSAINKENTTFCVIATKFGEAYSATVNKIGDGMIRMTGSAALSSNWDNPSHTFSLNEGSQDINFYPDYDLPLSVRPLGSFANFAAFVDGKLASTDENSETTFLLNPYYPASASGAQLHSTITLITDGTAAKTGTVSLTATNTTAKMLYSDVRAAGGSSVTLLYGTKVYIVPTTANCNITVNGALVHGEAANGTKVNGLNADGEYVYTVNEAKAEIDVTVDNSFAIVKTSPADGATVNQITSVKVYLPMEIGSNYNMPYTSEELVANVTLTAENGTTYHANGIGEPGQDYITQCLLFPLTFDAVTEAGTYTLTIPAGTFFEAEWDDDWGYVEVTNGAKSKVYTATITVDPNAKSPLDTYTLTPASGSALKSLKVIYMTLPKYSASDQIPLPEEYIPGAFSNGAISYNAMISYDWEYSEARRLLIIPCNDSYEEQVITEDGTWELYLPAGTLKYEDEVSSAIEATYSISAGNPAYPITPTPGSVTGNLGKFTIEITGAAAEVEYADEVITLTGAGDFSASTTYVSGLNPFTIQFSELPTEPGDYTLTIPAGAFVIDGQPSEEVIAHYTYKPVYELTPASKSTVENLDEITITFPDATSVEFNGNEQSFVLTVMPYYAAPGYNCERVNDNTFRLTILEGAQAIPTGTASFLIEEGAFTIDGEASPEIHATYTVQHQVSTEWQATPEKTIVYADYGFFWAFVFDESARVSTPDMSKIHVNFCGEDLSSTQYDVMSEANNLMMQITAADLLKEGELIVTIDEGAFNISGTPNPEMTYTWNVVAPKNYTSTVIPSNDNVVNDLSTITVAFPEAKTAEVYNENGVSLVKSDYSYRVNPTITAVADGEYPAFKFEFNPEPVTLGDYILTCRQGAFTLDGAQESPEIELTYSFDKNSGVWNIGVDGNGNVTIVTVDGRVIAADVPASEVNTLEKGKVYIINGVKVYIK